VRRLGADGGTLTPNGPTGRRVAQCPWNSRMTLIRRFAYHLVMPNDPLAQKAWRRYEEVARYLLDRFAKEFGLKFVEGKQEVEGQLTEWEIDAKGVAEDDADGTEGFVIVECRRRSKKQTQGEVGQLAFAISDTGASGGIVVSPFGLQKGAKERSSTNFEWMAFYLLIRFLLPPRDRRMMEKRGHVEPIPARLNKGQRLNRSGG
jgi:hypothetical protein